MFISIELYTILQPRDCRRRMTAGLTVEVRATWRSGADHNIQRNFNELWFAAVQILWRQ